MNTTAAAEARKMNDDELKARLEWMLTNINADTPAWFSADFAAFADEWNTRGAK